VVTPTNQETPNAAGGSSAERKLAARREWLIGAAWQGGLTKEGAAALLDEYDAMGGDAVLNEFANWLEEADETNAAQLLRTVEAPYRRAESGEPQ